MLTKTQEQILAFLIGNQEERVTISGIARRLGKSYTLVYNNIFLPRFLKRGKTHWIQQVPITEYTINTQKKL